MAPMTVSGSRIAEMRARHYSIGEEGWGFGLRCAGDEQPWPCDASTLAAMLTPERLAAALIASGLMARYSEYALEAHPDTMQADPDEEVAAEWADLILVALEQQP